jgi:predicted alpha/beta-fold hydrolase
MDPESFLPAPALRSPHVQTLLGSRGRGRWVARRADRLLARSCREVITCADGIALEAWISLQPQPAPLIVLIHGWLGHADSNYILSSGAMLFNAGFSVARLNLRDHGDTAHLNEEIYNAARSAEVIDAVRIIRDNFATGPVGIAGFSLGGNFALRVARALRLPTIAICPALDPANTLRQIDLGWVGYRLYFVRKWQRAMRQKQAAFPERYEFESALRLSTVAAMTDFFVNRYSEFVDTSEYFAAYTLTGRELEDCDAIIVYSEDDPVIPASDFRALPGSLQITALRHGGHCAFIESLTAPTWIDRFLSAKFAHLLTAQECDSAHSQV